VVGSHEPRLLHEEGHVPNKDKKHTESVMSHPDSDESAPGTRQTTVSRHFSACVVGECD
jgi:hypothetical protein